MLFLKDGQRVTGVLVERTESRTILRISGIDTPFRTDLINRIQIQPPTMERYREMRASIDPGDVERLLMLAEWLRFREKYRTALIEVDRVLAVEPENADARRLRTLIIEQLALSEKAKARAGAPDEDDSDPHRTSPPGRPVDFPLLTPGQINLIKVFEIDLTDPPRMLIRRETVARLMEEYAGDTLIPSTRDGREAMFRKRPEQILETMFRLRARQFYPEVEVQDHPEAMRLFRENVHRTWLINACATTRCHGGTEAGRLVLYNRRSNTDAAAYTNFLILDRFRLNDGTPLIDYDEPERSPLLQMGLQKDNSVHPHPQVGGPGARGPAWKPIFGSPDDRRFRQAVEWIEAMYRPRPEYPIDYEPPAPHETESASPPPDGPAGER